MASVYFCLFDCPSLVRVGRLLSTAINFFEMAAETDMKNLIGALLFYGYMAAAIALILLILGNSWAFKERTGGRNLTASLYYMLAQFSFVMLSNNMVSKSLSK